METQRDFFLSAAGESTELATPRACRVKGRLTDENRDDHMLIEINPPLIGQYYGFRDRDLTNLILSARYEGSCLFPVNEWPCPVYIARILDDAVIKRLAFTRNQVEMIAWGMIFRTLHDATVHAREFE